MVIKLKRLYQKIKHFIFPSLTTVQTQKDLLALNARITVNLKGGGESFSLTSTPILNFMNLVESLKILQEEGKLSYSFEQMAGYSEPFIRVYCNDKETFYYVNHLINASIKLDDDTIDVKGVNEIYLVQHYYDKPDNNHAVEVSNDIDAQIMAMLPLDYQDKQYGMCRYELINNTIIIHIVYYPKQNPKTNIIHLAHFVGRVYALDDN